MKKLFILMLSFLSLWALELTSDIGDYFHKSNAFNQFGCGGENISPALFWKDTPKNTQSFVLTIYDIDAPKGWWHWIVLNIPAKINSLEKNASMSPKMPKGVIELKNSYGTFGYGGPCPPVGDKPHRYVFTLYALDKKINPHRKDIEKQIKKHIIQKATFTALYKR